jgi:hypothetical protein
LIILQARSIPNLQIKDIHMKKLKIQFTEKLLTKNAGLYLLSLFADKLSLKNLLEKEVHIERGITSQYKIADILMLLILSVLAGAKHISQVSILRHDDVVRAYLELNKFPADTTIRRLFGLFTFKNCVELDKVEKTLRDKVWSYKWFGRVAFDMDSTVKGVYGSQEGAEKGYNARKKGQKSYHPLLCFIAENRECFHNWFRPGSSYTSNGAIEFTKECLARKPKHIWKIFVRADSGYFSGDFLEYLESQNCEYLIKVKLKGLKRLLISKKWRKVRNQYGTETAKFLHKCQSWKKTRNFLAVRNMVEEPDETMLIPEPKYEYFCYVSNCHLTPMKAHKCYGQRATSENWIEWCKNHMASGNILTQNFWANAAIFQSCILAYNLLVWMMWLNAENGFKEEPNTIRTNIINVPGKLIHSGRARILKLPENYIFKEQIEKILKSINQ